MLPRSQDSRLHFSFLESKDYVPGSGVEQINIRPQADPEAHLAGGIDLRYHDDLAMAQHSQMTRLTGCFGDLLHERIGRGDQTLRGTVFVGQLKEFERELVAFVGVNLADVAALVQAHQHSENFSDRATEAVCDFAMSEWRGIAG
jgi:hypothetical protein